MVLLKSNTFQVKASGEDSDQLIYNQKVSAPDTSCLISNLEAFSQYDFRMACQSSQGISNWTAWVTIGTSEGGKHICSLMLKEKVHAVLMFRSLQCYGAVFTLLILLESKESVFTVARCVRSVSAKH